MFNSAWKWPTEKLTKTFITSSATCVIFEQFNTFGNCFYLLSHGYMCGKHYNILQIYKNRIISFGFIIQKCMQRTSNSSFFLFHWLGLFLLHIWLGDTVLVYMWCCLISDCAIPHRRSEVLTELVWNLCRRSEFENITLAANSRYSRISKLAHTNK